MERKLDIYDYDFLDWCEHNLEDENCNHRNMEFWFEQLANNKEWAQEKWNEYLGENNENNNL